MFEEKDNFVIMEEGLREVWEGVKKFWLNFLLKSKVIRIFVGLRFEFIGGDFIIKVEEEVWVFINVVGICFLGLISVLVIVYEVRDII